MRRIESALCALALVGCGLNHGFIRDDTSSHEFRYNMQLSGEQFIKTVSGSATDGSVLCFIPISSQTYKRAMDELYGQAQLGRNQEVVNLREDHGIRAYFFFYCTWELTISGDVVAFEPVASAAREGPSAEAAPETPVTRFSAPAGLAPTPPPTGARSMPMTTRCASDDSCPTGSTCVKAQLALEGYCTPR